MPLNWKNELALTLAILLLVFCGPVRAENLKNIQRHYMKHQDFTVNFTQDTYQVLVNKTVHFTGKVSYKRDTGVRMDVLVQENGLSDPGNIRVGQKLFIPD